MRRKISQREARSLKKRVQQLEQERREQRNRWARNYPGGTVLGLLEREPDWLTGRIDAAHILGHAVVVRQDNRGHLQFHALPLP